MVILFWTPRVLLWAWCLVQIQLTSAAANCLSNLASLSWPWIFGLVQVHLPGCSANCFRACSKEAGKRMFWSLVHCLAALPAPKVQQEWVARTEDRRIFWSLLAYCVTGYYMKSFKGATQPPQPFLPFLDKWYLVDRAIAVQGWKVTEFEKPICYWLSPRIGNG